MSDYKKKVHCIEIPRSLLRGNLQIIISNTCDNSGFLVKATNMKIAVVSELTA